MVASPNPVRPGQQFVLTTTISCGRQMSTSASPYYPSMYYMVSSSPRLNGVYGGPSLSGDRRTATFSVTLTAPATKGDFNMYAYGRDNPTGGTCTGNSYNFSNSATTRLTVDATPTVTTVAPTVTTVAPTVTTVAIATTVPTTVATSTSINLLQSLDGPGTLAPLPTTTTQPEIIYSVQAERPVSISPEARSVTVPVSAIQTLFDSISPEYRNAARVSMRASDGKWKTVRAVDMKDTNIELSDKSQHIEIQLIIEGKDPIIYNITLNRGAPSSSDNSNLLGALGALLLLGGWLFLVGKRRRQNER
ncbi:MAG: LPXTG cell wall anchor domain-containing protein [Actinobacteria bacterium]|nr:LPXTG cell wall anchor domain-containing protein [Actinomycetota bacterium]